MANYMWKMGQFFVVFSKYLTFISSRIQFWAFYERQRKKALESEISAHRFWLSQLELTYEENWTSLESLELLHSFAFACVANIFIIELEV